MNLSEAISVLRPLDRWGGPLVEKPEGEALRTVLASLTRVSDLHHRRAWRTTDFFTFNQTEFPDLCDHCRRTWPCETAKAAGLDA